MNIGQLERRLLTTIFIDLLLVLMRVQIFWKFNYQLKFDHKKNCRSEGTYLTYLTLVKKNKSLLADKYKQLYSSKLYPIIGRYYEFWR